jgi:hypothetical protein
MVLAHAGHVLIDLVMFLVPVGTIATLILIARLRG